MGGVIFGIFFVIAVGAPAVALAVFLARGAVFLKASRWLDRGFEHAKRGEYQEARQAILYAVRMYPKLKKTAGLSELYEVIVSKAPANAAFLASQLQSEIPQRVESKLEKFYREPAFKAVLILFVILLVVFRLAQLFQ